MIDCVIEDITAQANLTTIRSGYTASGLFAVFKMERTCGLLVPVVTLAPQDSPFRRPGCLCEETVGLGSQVGDRSQRGAIRDSQASCIGSQSTRTSADYPTPTEFLDNSKAIQELETFCAAFIPRTCVSHF